MPSEVLIVMRSSHRYQKLSSSWEAPNTIKISHHHQKFSSLSEARIVIRSSQHHQIFSLPSEVLIIIRSSQHHQIFSLPSEVLIATINPTFSVAVLNGSKINQQHPLLTTKMTQLSHATEPRAPSPQSCRRRQKWGIVRRLTRSRRVWRELSISWHDIAPSASRHCLKSS
jgi:hypothetical protein